MDERKGLPEAVDFTCGQITPKGQRSESIFGMTIGDSPENMPLDTSLNNDIHKKVEEKVLMKLDMDTKHEEKFNLGTPAK
jgi:hypothetical protein